MPITPTISRCKRSTTASPARSCIKIAMPRPSSRDVMACSTPTPILARVSRQATTCRNISRSVSRCVTPAMAIPSTPITAPGRAVTNCGPAVARCQPTQWCHAKIADPIKRQRPIPYQRPLPACHDHSDDSDIGFSAFTDFASLVMSENDRKQVNIGRWNNGPKDYVYLAANPNNLANYAGAGFYEATRDINSGRMNPQCSAVKYTPADGDNLGVNIGVSIYIQYVGDYSGPVTTTGWVQKQLESFDQQTWTPKFAEGGDSAFTPETGRDYYINSNGANFVEKRKHANSTIAASDYEVWIELQSSANPVNVATILPPGTSYLRTPWRADARYKLETDENSPNFLKLVSLTDDSNTPDVDESATSTVHTSGEWGLRAYNDSNTPDDFTDDKPLKADGTVVTADPFTLPADQRPAEFNWEYSQDGGFGTQQYLVKSNGEYLILSNPVQITVASGDAVNAAGDPVNKPLTLQFDGWMHGLPDLYNELSKNGWAMDDKISSKVINIPAGTEVTDGSNVSYYVKPLEVSVFLDQYTGIPSNAPDITQAEAVSLDSGMPPFVEHNMGALPSGTVIKYSEGKAVE